jgi:hypothetical protein
VSFFIGFERDVLTFVPLSLCSLIIIEAVVGSDHLTAATPLFALVSFSYPFDTNLTYDFLLLLLIQTRSMAGMQYADSSAFLSGVAPSSGTGRDKKTQTKASPQDTIYITTGAVLGGIILIWFFGALIHKRMRHGPHAYAGPGIPTETQSRLGSVGEMARRWQTEMASGVSRLIASTKEKVNPAPAKSAPAKSEAISSTTQLNLEATEEGRGGGEPPSLSQETPTTPPSTTTPRDDHTIEVPHVDNWWTVRDEKVVLSWTGEAGESGVADAGEAAPAFSPASVMSGNLVSAMPSHSTARPTSGNPVSVTSSNLAASPSTSASPSRRSVPVPAPGPNSNMKPYNTEPYTQDVGSPLSGSSSQAPAGPSSLQASPSSSSPRGAPPKPNMSTKPSRTRSPLVTSNPSTAPSAPSVSNAGATVGSQKKDSEDDGFRVQNYEDDAGGRLSVETEPPPGYHDVNPQPQPSTEAAAGSGAVDTPRLGNHDGDGLDE